MSISDKFRENLLDLIADNEVKKTTKLAKEIGIDYRPLFYAIEYGIIPKPRTLIKIADYFNTSIDYLLGNSENGYFEKAKVSSDFSVRLNELCKAESPDDYSVISKACKFNTAYIPRWIEKKYIPELAFLEILCDHFNVSIDYLLGRTDDDTPYRD